MYTLRFPFELPPGQAISDPNFSWSLNALDVSLQKEGRYYVLNITGFNSEREAQDFLPNLLTGLRWVLLNRNLSFKAEIDLQRVSYSDAQ